MFGNPDLGNLRVVLINGSPLFCSNVDFYPKQEMDPVELLQGGPRTLIYSIGKKTFERTLSIPLYVDTDGNIAEPCKEVIRCADNPLRSLSLTMNYGIMGEPLTADLYQSPLSTDSHKRLTLGCCYIQKLTITVENAGPITMEVSIIGLPDDENEDDYDVDVPTEGLMARQCSFADCIIRSGADGSYVYWENIQEFNLSFENKVEPLYLVTQSKRDYADYLLAGETHIFGEWTEIKKAEEWDDEKGQWKHGGYFDDFYLKIKIADIVADIRDIVMKPQSQPLGVGILKRKTEFIVTFRHGWVSETRNLVFSDL